MSSCKFVALFWVEESAFSVQSTHTICVPRKEAWEYKPGDRVQAKFAGKLYTADVICISDDKKALHVEGNQYVEKYKAQKERSSKTVTETAKPKKKKTATVSVPSTSVQESVRDALKKDALLKARKERAERAEALKQSKQRVLEEMDSLLQSSFTSGSDTGTSEEETNLEDVPRNSKGHPTMAVKQPRKRRMGEEEEDNNPCGRCSILEDELDSKNTYIKKLEEQLESLQSARRRLPSTSQPPLSSFERPKPGYYPNGCSSMKELLPHSSIYLYEDQLRRASNKISLGPEGRRDGSSCARYLLGIFFSKEDMSNKSLTSDGQYPCLNPYLVNGIIEYTMSISDSLRSQITKVMRNKLSAFRCRGKKHLNKAEAVL